MNALTIAPAIIQSALIKFLRNCSAQTATTVVQATSSITRRACTKDKDFRITATSTIWSFAQVQTASSICPRMSSATTKSL